MKQIITTKKGTTYEREWNVKSYYSHINIRIDENALNKLRKIAKKRNLKYSDIVRDLIDEYIGKEEV